MNEGRILAVLGMVGLALVGLVAIAAMPEPGRLVKRAEMEMGKPTKVTLTRHCGAQ